MGNSGAYLALGMLGGVGKGMTDNAAMELDEYKRQTDFMRQKSLVDLRHQYGVEDTANAREHEAGLLETANIRTDKLTAEQREYQEGVTADSQAFQTDRTEAGWGNAASVLESKQDFQIEQTEAGRKNAAKVKALESPKYNASRIKATKDLVESDFIQDFLDERRQLPEEERSMTEFALDDALNPDKKYNIDKMMGVASPTLRTKYKVLSQLSEKYAHNGELPPEQAFAMAKSEYEARLNDQQIADGEKAAKDQKKEQIDIKQKSLEKSAKALKQTVAETRRISLLPTNKENVEWVSQKLLDNPKLQDIYLRELKGFNPELFVEVNEIIETSKKPSSSQMYKQPSSYKPMQSPFSNESVQNLPVNNAGTDYEFETSTNPKLQGLLDPPIPSGPRRTQ